MAGAEADSNYEQELTILASQRNQHGADCEAVEELERKETERLQYVQTMGSGRPVGSNTERDGLPAFGGGKSYPPLLDSVLDAYVVDFDGPGDSIHPLNWPFWTKWVRSYLHPPPFPLPITLVTP